MLSPVSVRILGAELIFYLGDFFFQLCLLLRVILGAGKLLLQGFQLFLQLADFGVHLVGIASDGFFLFFRGLRFPLLFVSLLLLKGYTLNAAAQSHWEDKMGSLTPGKLTNMVITNKNPFGTPLHQIKDIQTETVLFEGKAIKGSL